MGKFFKRLLEAVSYAQIADEIGIDFSEEKFTLAQFSKGLEVEYKEHGPSDPQTNVIGDSKMKAGKVALAHLKERPDYYEQLAKIEESGKEILPDGTIKYTFHDGYQYYKDGKLHREDGPAYFRKFVEFGYEVEDYFVHGKRFSKEEFHKHFGE